MSLNKDQLCEIVNEIIYFVAIAPFLYLTVESKWTETIQNAYIGIILLNTMFLALVSLIFLIMNLIKKVMNCKKKSKKSETQVQRINASQRADGDFSNICSNAPINNTRRETEIPRFYDRDLGKQKLSYRIHNRAEDHNGLMIKYKLNKAKVSNTYL